jgi:capsular polysaccharide biosynthesis protein
MFGRKQGNMQEFESSDVEEIDLGDLFLYLLSHWKFIAVFSIAGTVIALLITLFLITPLYEATSTIYVLSRKDSAVNISDLQIGSALTQDYMKVFDIWEVHEEVISNLNLPYTYDQLRKKLKVTNANDTRMLDISITSADPEEAAKIANEYAAVSSDFIADTMSTEKPNIVSAALVPVNPVSPSKTRNVIIGFLVGLVLAVGIQTVRYLLDDKIKTADDIRKYCDLSTLAIVPYEGEATRNAEEAKHRHRSGKRSRSEKRGDE